MEPRHHNITIKTPREIELLRQAGGILFSIITELTGSLKIGMTTAQIDALAEGLMAARHVIPAFKGYRGYPACVCVSVNQEVVHGIPGAKVIQEHDIVSIDAGVIHEGYYADTAVSVGIGAIDEERRHLLEVTRESLHQGIAQARAGNHLSDISHAVQAHVEANGFSVVRDFVGHGIGKSLHEEPEIPNFGVPHQGPALEEGMVFAIEPMVNAGSYKTKIMDNGWTVETMDGKPSAHFEHTVAITASGPQILTQAYG